MDDILVWDGGLIKPALSPNKLFVPPQSSSFKKNNSIDIKVAVKTIGNLPSLLLPKGIEYTSNEARVVKAYDFFFQGLEVWLQNLVLKQALNPAAMQTGWKHFQGHAAMDAALLNLISGLHPRVPSFQKACPEKEAPSIIWLVALAIDTANVLKESGLMLDPDLVKNNFYGRSILIGKNDYCLNNITLLDQWDEQIRQETLTKTAKKKRTQAVYTWKDCPITYLCKVAAHQAKWDPDFDEQYWQPYSQITRYWTRKIRDNKILQAGCLLPNGDLFITGLGKKIPTSVKLSLGFG